MSRKIHIIILCCFGVAQLLWSQESSFTGVPQATTHTYIEYNQFLFNPATSFNQEAAYYNDPNGYFSFFGKLDKVGFEDGPRNFGGTYSRTFNEHMSFGVALLQQSIGIFSNFGGVLNYAYSVEIDKNTSLALGTNLRFQSSSLRDISTFESTEGDASLNAFEKNTLLKGSLGTNLHYKNFDFGVAGRNLLNTALSGNPSLFDNPTIVVHTMMSKPVRRRSDNIVGGMLYYEKVLNGGTSFGVNGIVKNKNYGFAQLGYNQTFGVSLGIGFNVAPFATIGYTLERGIGDTGVFGTSHEVVLAYNITKPIKKAGGKKGTKKPKEERQLPEREELSRAEQLIALKKARAEQEAKLAALQDTRNKAELLRNKKSQEQQQKLADEELYASLNEQLDDNDVANAGANLKRILNSPYIDDERKKSINSKYTRVTALLTDIDDENTRIAEETRAKNETRSALQRFNQYILDGNEKDARATLQRINGSKYASVEEKAALASKLDRLSTRLEDKAIVASTDDKNKRADSELLRVSTTLLDDGNLAQAQTNSKLIRSSKYLTKEEKASFLNRLSSLLVEEKEKEASKNSLLARVDKLIEDDTSLSDLEIQSELIKNSSLLNDDEKQSTLARINSVIADKRDEQKTAFLEQVNSKIANASPVELRAQQSLIRESKLLNDAEKQSQLTRIASIINEKQQSSDTLFTETETTIANANVEELVKQSNLIRNSTLLSDGQKQSLLQRIIKRQKDNEVQQVALEEAIEKSLVAANVEDLEKQSQLLNASTFIPAEKKSSLLKRITSVRNYRETVDDISTTLDDTEKLEDVSIEDLKRQSLLVRTAAFLPTAQKKSMLQKISRLVATKEQEVKVAEAEGDLKKVSRLQRSTKLTKTQEDLIVEAINQAQISINKTGDLEELREQKAYLQSQEIIPIEEREALVESIDVKIARIEAIRQRAEEETRLAEERRQAEIAAKLAEARQRKETLDKGIDNLIADGTIEDLEGQLSLLDNNTSLTDAEKKEFSDKISKEIERRKQAAELDKLKDQEITVAENIIASGTISDLQKQSSLVRSSTYLSNEDKASLLEKIETKVAEKTAEANRITLETQQREAAISAAENVINNGSIDELEEQSNLVRSTTLIPEDQKKSLLERISTTIANKEAEADRIALETQQREAAISAAENVITNGSVAELQRQSTLLRSSTLIPNAQKEVLLNKIETKIAGKQAEEKRVAEAVIQREQEIAAVENAVSTGNVEELKRQSTLLRSSTTIPNAQKQALLERISSTIITKEAEEEKVAEVEQTISTGTVQDLEAQVSAIQNSDSITKEKKEELLEQVTETIVEKETVAVEETINEGNIEALKRKATLLRSSSFIPAKERQSLLQRITKVIEDKEVEEQKKQREEEIRVAENLIESGDVEALRRQSTLLRSSKIIPNEEKEDLLERINTSILEKEAEEAKRIEEERIAEEQRLAEEARLAEIKRQEEARKAEQARLALEAEQRAVAVNNARSIIANGSIDNQRAAIEDVKSNSLLDATQKETLVKELENSIAAKEAEAARIEEEKRLAEEARLAEIKRQEEARKAEQARLALEAEQRAIAVSKARATISNGSIADQKAAISDIKSNTLLDAGQKEELIKQLEDSIAAKEAEQARIVEQKRLEEQARLAEERRLAEIAERKQTLISETKSVLTSGSLETLRSQRNKLNGDNTLSAEEKRDLIVQIDAEIGYKEAEIRRVEEERKRAEEARLAEIKRQEEARRKAEADRLEKLRLEEEERRRVEQARIAEQKRLAQEEARKAEEARLAEEARIAEEARLEQERLARKKNSSLTRSSTVVKEEEKRKSAVLTRESKIIKDEKEKEARRKAVQAELKRTTKVIKPNSSGSGSGARLKRTIRVDPNKQGSIQRTPKSILELQQEFFERELHLSPKLEVTKIPFVQWVNALVNSNEVSELIEDSKTIDLNKKNRKVLKTKLKTIRTSENK